MSSLYSQSIGGNENGRLSPHDGETSLALLFAAVWGRRRLVLWTAAVGLVVGGVFGVTRPHTYTSHASFTADDQHANSAGAIAGQLGLSALLGGASQSSQLFVDAVQAPVILGPVAESTYTVDRDGAVRRVTLLDLYAGKSKSPLERRAHALDHLKREIKCELRSSGAISVDVSTTDRRLSTQIAVRVLGELNEFSQNRRQQRATNERRFSEGRVAEAKAELAAAEDRLENFMQQNRGMRSAPALAVQQDRLQREVSFRQAMYTSVAQAYEQARMDEARNTPTVSVVEPASFPLTEDPRWGGLKSGLLGLIVGLAGATAYILLRDLFYRSVAATPKGIEGHS